MAKKQDTVAGERMAEVLPEGTLPPPLTKEKKSKKTECPVSRTQFIDHATPIKATIGNSTLALEPRQFSTNSLGWFSNEKITVEVNGVPVKVQCNVNLTVIGSKDLPK
jgi:hypothetical protein